MIMNNISETVKPRIHIYRLHCSIIKASKPFEKQTKDVQCYYLEEKETNFS
jgi:hypothetical protein